MGVQAKVRVGGSSKALKGIAAQLFGASPNQNSKLDIGANKASVREDWAMKTWALSWEVVRAKLARREVDVYTLSLPAGSTCPGKSEMCKLCYAMKGRMFMQQSRYQGTLDILNETCFSALLESIMLLPEGAWIRIHASGDFYSAAYIAAWVEALRLRPDIKAWAYTRSWAVPELRESLEVLRALPNMQLFASVDTSMHDTSYVDVSGWRIAFIEGDARYEGKKGATPCPEQNGDAKRPDCKACALCPIGKRGNIRFSLHSNAREAIDKFLQS